MEKGTELAASMVVRNKNNVWIADDMVDQCYHCGRQFTFFLRRHHCRSCGNIFCHYCCNNYMEIPQFIIDRPEAINSFWNLGSYFRAASLITSNSSALQKERVCLVCREIIHEKIQGHQKILKHFDNLPDIDRINSLPPEDSDLKNYYLDYFRNIQYYLPNHHYNSLDVRILQANSAYLSRHSKYLVHYLKSIDWRSHNLSRSQDLSYIFKIIHGNKNKTCEELYCTRTCQEILSFDDCVNILYSTAKELPEKLLQYLMDIIIMTQEKQVIICHLPFFVNLVKKNERHDLYQLVYRLVGQDKKMLYHIYWLSTIAKTSANLREVTNLNNFLSFFDKNMLQKMYQEYIFYVGLIKNLDNVVQYLELVFQKCKPVCLPYNPEIELVDVDMTQIVVKSSQSRPVILRFRTQQDRYIRIMFKRESIFNDLTVINLITLSDIILNENLNTQFGIVVYPVMPITYDTGMIEIIDHAETIYDIFAKKHTILQYIIENNEESKVKDIMDHYMYSLVSYTLHSYFLGLGDRHLQNIMVTRNGALFHIDFSFILGNDAHPITGSNIRLNSNMLETLGGSESYRYRLYLEYCAKGITILRKYFNLFFILLCQNLKYTEKQIEQFIMSRFQPRQVDEVVVYELMTVINNSNNAFIDYIKDYLHYHTQERTLQSGLKKIVRTTYNAIKNII